MVTTEIEINMNDVPHSSTSTISSAQFNSMVS